MDSSRWIQRDAGMQSGLHRVDRLKLVNLDELLSVSGHAFDLLELSPLSLHTGVGCNAHVYEEGCVLVVASREGLAHTVQLRCRQN